MTINAAEQFQEANSQFTQNNKLAPPAVKLGISTFNRDNAKITKHVFTKFVTSKQPQALKKIIDADLSIYIDII